MASASSSASLQLPLPPSHRTTRTRPGVADITASFSARSSNPLSSTRLKTSLRRSHAYPLSSCLKPSVGNTALGKFFFSSVATPESVRNILCQCYHDSSRVTDELVEKILQPGLQPGAADDEAPQLVNPLEESFVARHNSSSIAAGT